MWEPSAGGTNDAHRIIDWLIKNRGNFLQWAALDDILVNPDRYAAWLPYTQELIADAHARGIRVGLAVELFGQSNLQLAFDLYDDTTGTISIHDQVAQRLPIITNNLPFDVYALSYGEFFDSDPATFINGTNEVSSQLHALAPNAEMHAVVHVGGTQLVTYMGQTMIYYFLVQFADPTIIPDIHTVMYYDMFEDVGGAYQMDNFRRAPRVPREAACARTSRLLIIRKMRIGSPFDDSMPLYMPLYVRSRWLDRDQLPTVAPPPCAPLDEELLFSERLGMGLLDARRHVIARQLRARRVAARSDRVSARAGSGRRRGASRRRSRRRARPRADHPAPRRLSRRSRHRDRHRRASRHHLAARSRDVRSADDDVARRSRELHRHRDRAARRPRRRDRRAGRAARGANPPRLALDLGAARRPRDRSSARALRARRVRRLARPPRRATTRRPPSSLRSPTRGSPTPRRSSSAATPTSTTRTSNDSPASARTRPITNSATSSWPTRCATGSAS